MHHAVVSTWGEPPKYASTPEPSSPEPGQVRIKVKAVGAHRLVLSRAAGKHYSSCPLPHVPGVDGVGTTDDGNQVYFISFTTGTMSEYINLPTDNVIPMPEGLDPLQVAGLTNPAMSSWMALKTRTTELPKDFTVLILGATSASGRVAIPLVRSLGAKRVIGAARNKDTLATLDLDESVIIAEDVTQTDFSTLGDVDIILDYLYGPLIPHLFKSLKSNRPTQFAQIGSMSGIMDITLPASAIRSKDLTIRGSGTGSWTTQQLASEMPNLLRAMKDLPRQPVKVVKLEHVEELWKNTTKERHVFEL